MNRESQARAFSPGGWGEVATFKHPRYCKPNPKGRRRCWYCKQQGHLVRASHVGMANGVALTGGCEFHVMRWVMKDKR
jgi:hypothetical protein